jgi:peptide/nickel transport system permease protein
VSTEIVQAQLEARPVASPMLVERGRSYNALSAILRFARRKPLGAAGAVVIVFLVVVAFAGPAIAPYDPLLQDSTQSLKAPSAEHPMGTDRLGRDQLSRIIYGARVSLYVGLLSVIMGTIIGMAIGITSAYVGGKFDLVVQRFVDTMMGFPGLVLVLIMVVALGPSLFNVTLAIAVNYSDKVIRLSRSAALSVKGEDYILAARAVGVGTWRILYRHVAPNTLAPIFVLASAQLGASIVTEAGLSFLGLGVQPPTPSWGNMLQAAATTNMEAAPWLAIYPGLALAVVTFAFAVFGDALRDVLDPRLRGT